MKEYIGTKQVKAKPLTRLDYNTMRGWQLPANEEGSDDGYLVEYQDGYVSWSPKKQFEEAYRLTEGLTFGLAVEVLKSGGKVARAGWNGKGMWLSLGSGNPANPAASFWNRHTRAFAEQNGGTAPVLPYVIMKTATGEILMGWLASQTDILAEDWQVVP
jgi:hypothetical protein